MKNKEIMIFSIMLLLGACSSEVTSSSSVSQTNKPASSSSKVVISSSSSNSDNIELDLELKVKSFDVTEVTGINKKIQIPDYSAKDKHGNDITDLVQITDSLLSDINLSKKTITLLEPGEHNIVFSVTDPNDSTLTKTKEFKIQCYREILNFDNMHSEINLKSPIEEQYVVSHNPDKGLGRLNIDSGKMYYAEAYFDGSVDVNVCKGLAHVVSTDNDEGSSINSWLISMINVDTKKHAIVNSRNYSWTEVLSKDVSSYNIENLDLTNGFKFAIARYGNTLYSFLNDTLIETYTHDVLANIDTTPALYTYMGGAFEEITVSNDDGTTETIKKNLFAETGIKITNIDYYNDVKAFNKLKSLNVQELSDSIFELSKNKICVEVGSRIDLPVVIAYKEGRNLLDTLKIYDVDNNELEDKYSYTCEEKGKYVYTYKVYDEETDVYLEQELIIDVIETVFANKNTNYITLELEDDNSLTIVQNGHNSKSSSYEGDVEDYQHYAIGAFNLSPSKLYYAEATINTHKTYGNGGTWTDDGNTLFGMAHVRSLASGRAMGNNFISSGVRGYGRSLIMNKYTNNEKRNPSKDDSSIAYIEDYISTLKWNSPEFKIAIARDGDILYTFINDEYIAGFYDAEYASQDTLPGVFSTSFNSSYIETKFRKVDFFDGNLAKEKINTLLNNKGTLIPNYKDTRNASSKWSLNETTMEDGINLDILTSEVRHEETCFTNSVRYTKDFKFEFDFFPLEANTNTTDQGELSLFLMGYSNVRGFQVASMHTRFKPQTLTLDRFAIQADITKSWGDQTNVENYDVSKGMHYEVESTLNGTTRTFIFTVTSLADSTVFNTRTIELINGDAIPGSEETVYEMDGVFTFRFATKNLKAKFKNLTWTGL